MPTSNMEDYIERIYQLEQEKGYARVIEIADRMQVQSPSVTRMIQKLAKEGYVEYSRYRGIRLTARGVALGKSMKRRHASLDAFLRMIGVTDPKTIWKDVEGIEHHVSPATMEAIQTLVQFFEENGRFHEELAAFRRRPKEPAAKAAATPARRKPARRA